MEKKKDPIRSLSSSAPAQQGNAGLAGSVAEDTSLPCLGLAAEGRKGQQEQPQRDPSSKASAGKEWPGVPVAEERLGAPSPRLSLSSTAAGDTAPLSTFGDGLRMTQTREHHRHTRITGNSWVLPSHTQGRVLGAGWAHPDVSTAGLPLLGDAKQKHLCPVSLPPTLQGLD